MIPKEILKKVKFIELRTRKLVNNVFAGEYHTAFKGQGMTFSEFREYVPGDDVRTIYWPLTAKTGKTFIKKFEEERELTLLLVVDVSGSSDYGSGEWFKGEVMAHASAVLAYSAQKNNDQVGLLLFSDQIEHFVPPAKGHGHIQRMIRDLLWLQPKSRQTKMTVALSFLAGVLKRRASIFVMSDFLDSDFEQALRQLSKKHDVVAVVVDDPTETELPSLGLMDLEDAETGEILTVDTSSSEFRRAYKKEKLRLREARDKKIRAAQVDRVDISTAGDSIDPLIAFFKRRHRRV